MQLIRHHTAASTPCVATIGNFDGLHLGHQRVIEQVQHQSTQLKLPSCVISFDPLPAEYFAAPQFLRIYPLREKIRLLKALQVERFACWRFNQAFAEIPAEQFIEHLLIKQLQVRHLVVGDDFRFGHNRAGDYTLLKTMGESLGMHVVDTQTVQHNQERISSTRLRGVLNQGDLSTANTLLGRHYSISGRVRHGDKIGRTLNFPTLNLGIPDNLALADGVYAVTITGLGKRYTGVANLGKRPTVQGLQRRFEVHVFDFSHSVYGQYVEVTPLHFIRPQQKFASLEALKQQITLDCEVAREQFKQ